MKNIEVGDLRTVDFLSNFDSETRTQIIEFGKRISSKDLAADVYLIMARKAICFVDLLLQFKLAHLSGIVVSDRILDTDLSWLRGKSITIIDDALVSGTSIRKAIDKLKYYVDDDLIKVHVLSINYDWYKKESKDEEIDNPYEMLVRTNNDGSVILDSNGNAKSYLVKPFNYQTNEKCMRTCFDIVKALSKTPKPYDIDFPLYEDCKISEYKLNEILNSEWNPINIASVEYESDRYTKHKNNGDFTSTETKCKSISFFPSKDTIERILNVFGIEKFFNGALKIRSYIRERRKERSEYHISFLPCAIINELSNQEIDEILKNLANNSKVEWSVLSNIFTTYSSKFRLIQFLISVTIAHAFFAENGLVTIDKINGRQIYPELSWSRVKYIFPINGCKIVEDIVKEINGLGIDCSNKNKEIIIKSNQTNRKFHDISPLNPMMVFERLSDEFLSLYRLKELRARKLAKEYGHIVFSREDYKAIINRLDEGKTFNDLLNTKIPQKRFHGTGEKFLAIRDLHNSEFVVSIFLDYAIDMGIAVPITYTKPDSISRAYRHGEDVIFSDEEARLLAYMLYIFLERTQDNDNKEIGGVLAEKLFSMFIRLGLDYKIFSKYDYAQIANQTREYLKITYNLHGSTVRVNNSGDKEIPKTYTTADDKSKWLWEVLADKKLILCNSSMPTTDDAEHSISFSSECLDKFNSLKDSTKGIDSERIAETIGYCFKNGYLNTEDLILLNATCGHEEIIPALLAEIEIIRNSFILKSDYILRNSFSNWHALNFMQSNRNKAAFIAMNSGCWKFDKFSNNFSKNKIDKVKEELNSSAPREVSRNWVQMWNGQLSHMGDEQPSGVLAVLYSEANCVIQYSLVYRLLEYLAFQKINGKIKVKEYFQNLRVQLFGIKKDRCKAVIEDYNRNLQTNIYKSLLAYFKIIGVDKKINAKNIFDDEFVESVINANTMILDIKSYIEKYKKISNIKSFCNSNPSLEEIANNIIASESYENEYFEFIISHIKFLNNEAERLQRYANRYINLHGKIEKAIEYNNVAVILFATKDAFDFKYGIIDRINARRNRINNKEIELNYCERDNSILIFARGNKTDEALYRLIEQINCDFNLKNDLEIYYFLDLESICCPYRFSNSRAIFDNFNIFSSQIIGELKDQDLARTVIYGPNINIQDKTNILKDGDEMQLKIDNKDIRYKAVTKEDNIESNIKKGFTIGIICAKSTEFKGVRDAIINKFGVSFNVEFDRNENYRRNLIAYIKCGNVQHRIVLTQCEQGNTNSAIAYDALVHYKPDYVFFCGIAGSCDKNVKIGDVFIPFTIVDVTLKKAKNDRFESRGDAYKIQAHHIGLMEDFTDNCNKKVGELNMDFNISNDKAMSDNVVVACEDSEYLRGILAVNSKAAACVEMESAGLFDADYLRHKTKYGVYTIRGISDKANTVKDDKHHSLAINNASFVLTELLQFLFDKYNTIKLIKT